MFLIVKETIDGGRINTETIRHEEYLTVAIEAYEKLLESMESAKVDFRITLIESKLGHRLEMRSHSSTHILWGWPLKGNYALEIESYPKRERHYIKNLLIALRKMDKSEYSSKLLVNKNKKFLLIKEKEKASIKSHVVYPIEYDF